MLSIQPTPSQQANPNFKGLAKVVTYSVSGQPVTSALIKTTKKQDAAIQRAAEKMEKPPMGVIYTSAGERLKQSISKILKVDLSDTKVNTAKKFNYSNKDVKKLEFGDLYPENGFRISYEA